MASQTEQWAPVVDEFDPRFRIDESIVPGAGNGLFAEVLLPTGDCVEVIGVLVRAGSESDRCSHFADHHKFRIGDHLLIPLGYAGIVNHSATPNMEKIVEGDRAYLRALRPIQVGEELFWQYSDYAQERFGFR